MLAYLLRLLRHDDGVERRSGEGWPVGVVDLDGLRDINKNDQAGGHTKRTIKASTPTHLIGYRGVDGVEKVYGRGCALLVGLHDIPVLLVLQHLIAWCTR